jgi:tetratricopeptide (TPR) repeat protein
LARICLAAGETARAETLLRDSLDKAGHTPETWIAWMDYLAHTNQRDVAMRDIERMKKELAVPRQSLTLARCYEALHMQEQADRAYQDALRLRPDDFIALTYAADFYRQADRVDQAIQCYQRLLDPAKSAPAESVLAARRHLAVFLAQRGQASRALALLDNNKQSQGDTIADGRVRLFIQSQTESARESAIAKFQDSLGLQLPAPDERVLLAQMLEAAGYLGQARTQLAEAVNEQPTPTILVRYARLLIRLGERPEAERTVNRLETLEPSSARVRDLRKSLTRAN